MKSFSRAGLEVRHISKFDSSKPGIFYGILRGSGAAMRILKDKKIDFWYVDNGYFDAVYMNDEMVKNMDGKYRVVRNSLIEPYMGSVRLEEHRPLKILMFPPSVYSAFMHDTTPEDWLLDNGRRLEKMGHAVASREKREKLPLEKDLEFFDAVYACNSMAVMKAISMGKAVYTTDGIVKNSSLAGNCIPYYDFDEVKKFYQDKQFTLEEIQSGGLKCLN